jgi:hypothetical protein
MHQDLVLHEISKEIIEYDISAYLWHKFAEIWAECSKRSSQDLLLPGWSGGENIRALITMAAIDARRVLIQDLDDAIGNSFHMQSRPKESLGDCHSLLQVLQEEYDGCAGVLSARLYYDASQVSMRMEIRLGRACSWKGHIKSGLSARVRIAPRRRG